MRYENAIEIRGLNKSFQNFKLNNINMDLPTGSIMGFIGENGAGKTTTMKLILNQLKKESGTIRIMGMDHLTDEMAIKQEIGVVLDQGFFYESITPTQIAKIMAPLYNNWDDCLYRKYLDCFQLPPKQPIKEFSKGMRMKLSIIAALSHHPKLLLLDEPTSGLDPVIRTDILDLFLDFIQEEEHSILFSTHITTDLEKIADYITFIHNGEILLSDSKDSILDDYGILKCGISECSQIVPEDCTGIHKGTFGFQALVKNKSTMTQKYPFATVDPASLEDLMLYYIKK